MTKRTGNQEVKALKEKITSLQLSILYSVSNDLEQNKKDIKAYQSQIKKAKKEITRIETFKNKKGK